MKTELYSSKNLGKQITWEYEFKNNVVQHVGTITKYSFNPNNNICFLTAFFPSLNRDINIASEESIIKGNINAMLDKEFKI